MTELKRDFIKNDPVLKKLFEIIKRNHKVAEHTKRVLFSNKNVKDFCEEARHFAEMPGNKSLYIHYDVSSWYHKDGAQIRIDSIGIYDDFMEYEKARMYALHKAQNKDIPNIN